MKPNTRGKGQSRVCFRAVGMRAYKTMKLVILTMFLLACASVEAQSCLTQDDIRLMLARVEAPAPAQPDKKLKEELLKLANKQRELLVEVVE